MTLLYLQSITSGFVDNGILGDPYVDCGDNFIEVRERVLQAILSTESVPLL